MADKNKENKELEEKKENNKKTKENKGKNVKNKNKKVVKKEEKIKEKKEKVNVSKQEEVKKNKDKNKAKKEVEKEEVKEKNVEKTKEKENAKEVEKKEKVSLLKRLLKSRKRKIVFALGLVLIVLALLLTFIIKKVNLLKVISHRNAEVATVLNEYYELDKQNPYEAMEKYTTFKYKIKGDKEVNKYRKIEVKEVKEVGKKDDLIIYEVKYLEWNTDIRKITEKAIETMKNKNITPESPNFEEEILNEFIKENENNKDKLVSKEMTDKVYRNTKTNEILVEKRLFDL